MKKVFFTFVLFYLSIFAFAGPFGLKMGMSLEEVTEACNGVEPVLIERDCYSFTPVKPHPLFRYYYIFVDPQEGLYFIRVATDDINTNRYGTEIKNCFSEIKGRIEKIYGKPRVVDSVDPNSIYKDDEYWFKSLEEGARRYSAIWESSPTKELKDDLNFVGIMAKAYGYSYDFVGYIRLEYCFLNAQAVEESQDDVF
nr:hypothetical protein [uncultured Treponema sp.]